MVSMKENAFRLLAEVKKQIGQHVISNTERYEANILAFLNQCPDDVILTDAMVVWEDNDKFVFYWDTSHLDCYFTVGLEDAFWHIWVGENTHKQDDECYTNGIGGMEIKGNEDCFAYGFFDTMKYVIVTRSWR